MLPDPTSCPDCRLPFEPSPAEPDAPARVCPRCGLDPLAFRMRTIVGKAMLWDYRDVRVYLRWQKGGPSARELAAVKRLIPDLDELPAGDLGKVLGREPVWEVDVLPAQDALAFRAAARDQKLEVELVYLPETRGTSLDPHAHGDAEEE